MAVVERPCVASVWYDRRRRGADEGGAEVGRGPSRARSPPRSRPRALAARLPGVRDGPQYQGGCAMTLGRAMKSKRTIQRELASLKKEAVDSKEFPAIQQTLCWVLGQNVMAPVRYARLGMPEKGAAR